MGFPLDLDAVLALQRLMAGLPEREAMAVLCARWAILLNVPLAVLLYRAKRASARHAVTEAAWAVGIALSMVTCLSFVIRRLRPFQAWAGQVALLVPPPLNTSFPSGHTAASLAIALAFSLADRRIGRASFVLAALTAFGRMAVGVHYPTDILGGAAVGLVAFAFVRHAHVAIRARDIRRSVAHHHHA